MCGQLRPLLALIRGGETLPVDTGRIQSRSECCDEQEKKMPKLVRFRTLISLSVVNHCIIFASRADMNEYLWFVAFVSTVRADISPAFRVL